MWYAIWMCFPIVFMLRCNQRCSSITSCQLHTPCLVSPRQFAKTETCLLTYLKQFNWVLEYYAVSREQNYSVLSEAQVYSLGLYSRHKANLHFVVGPPNQKNSHNLIFSQCFFSIKTIAITLWSPGCSSLLVCKIVTFRRYCWLITLMT